MAKILVVEDDLSLCESLCDSLQAEHHTVESVHNGRYGLEMLLNYKFDLAILDWNLPELEGPEICRQFHEKGGSTPVLMLTARSSVSEKAQGLDSGADDYLTKPFHVDELRARVRALLRRAAGTKSNVLKLGDLVLDGEHYLVKKADNEVRLLPKEFALLEFLMRNPGKVYSAERLLEHVWQSETDASSDALRSCIKRLRKKIEIEGTFPQIETLHGVGYRLKGE